jgi:hypothetical protein
MMINAAAQLRVDHRNDLQQNVLMIAVAVVEAAVAAATKEAAAP